MMCAKVNDSVFAWPIGHFRYVWFTGGRLQVRCDICFYCFQCGIQAANSQKCRARFLKIDYITRDPT